MNDTLKLAVNGGLMRGFPDNKNMLAVNAVFLKEAQTKPIYRFFSIGDRHPAMLRVATGGVSIAVEVWTVPLAGLGIILQEEPPGLCIGKVPLEDGEEVLGVLGEAICCEQGEEITKYGGWRNYLSNRGNKNG